MMSLPGQRQKVAEIKKKYVRGVFMPSNPFDTAREIRDRKGMLAPHKKPVEGSASPKVSLLNKIVDQKGAYIAPRANRRASENVGYSSPVRAAKRVKLEKQQAEEDFF